MGVEPPVRFMAYVLQPKEPFEEAYGKIAMDLGALKLEEQHLEPTSCDSLALDLKLSLVNAQTLIIIFSGFLSSAFLYVHLPPFCPQVIHFVLPPPSQRCYLG